MKRKGWSIKILLTVMLLASVVQPGLRASAALAELPAVQYGQVVDIRQSELAPGATYTRLDLQDQRGPQNIHSVQFDPSAANLKLMAGTNNGKVYGMKEVTEMAAYVDAPENRVIAGINGDFYDISGTGTGVSNGLFMSEGRILNSGSGFAFGLTQEGRSLYGSPQLTQKLTLGSTTVNLNAINRYRGENQLVLYTSDYHTSTKSGSSGDEFVLDVGEGKASSGSVMKLKVVEARRGAGDSPLAEGTAVLSVSGTARELTKDLKVGDELTAQFSLAGEWNEAVIIIGGQGPLVQGGMVQSGVRPEGVHPRTAIGTKADGSLILLELDGRAPGFSEGMETAELGQVLKDLGAVDAINLDGGGSSTFAARLPGTASVEMLNRGSDGYERKVGNGLLLVNTAPELSSASSLVLQPDGERILQGSSYAFQAAAIDANGHPAAMNGTPVWKVDPALGTVNAQGQFIAAANTSGKGVIEAETGGIRGRAEIEIVRDLTALEFPDRAKTYTAGEQSMLSITAIRSGQIIQADNASFSWRVEGDIGSVDANGLFTAGNQNDAKGKIVAAYGTLEASFDVSVGIPPVMLEDFEEGVGKYIATGAALNSVSISEETDPDYVRGGSRSLKLQYDFIGKTGTSGAYLQASSVENRIQIPGYPTKIGMWVYGDGQRHWLRGQIRDGNNQASPVNFTEQSPGVDWTGWRYVEVDVPQGKSLPLTMDMPVRYMEINNANKTSGVLYVDNIRALYGPVEEDRMSPTLRELSPSPGRMVETAVPEISVIAEDEGYDPVAHPGTTLIDPEQIRMYVDGQLVSHSLYPPKGRIAYTPTDPLAEGRHSVKVAVRDLAGNQTIREWAFSVNLGSPYYVYDTPENLEVGGTYTLDVRAAKALLLEKGDLAFQFDPASLTDVQVIRGERIGEDSQVEWQVDETAGTVELRFDGVNRSGLEDDDILAQIQYTVRGNLIGPLTLEDAGVGKTIPLKIAYRSGSVVSTEGNGSEIKFVGPDVESTARSGLNLSWNPHAVGLGFESSFSISRAEDRAPVASAKLLLNGQELSGAESNASGLVTTSLATETTGSFTLQAVHGERYSPVMIFNVSPHAGTPEPFNVNVTMGEDAATSRNFNWQTAPSISDTVVELAKRSEFTGFDQSNVIRITGTNSLYTTNNDGSMNVHKAQAESLEPDTEYVYRVGDGAGLVSAQAAFRTGPSADAESAKFLFIGDSQAETQAGFALWGQTLAGALAYMPDADMIVHAGDMVDKGFEQEQWNWWFEAAGENLMNRTLVPIIGNHEVMGGSGSADYLAQFNNPQNGASGTLGTSYSFDAGNAHFVVLDTEQTQQGYETQAVWLDQDLAKSDKKWKIVFFHQGPYGSIYANERVQALWVPIFDKHGVDLVMNGHDHIYMRSFAMKNGQVMPDGEGTRYVIGGSSGPKFYALTDRFWQEKIDDRRTQIYTGVEVSEEAIELSVRALDGSEIDRLTIGTPSEEKMMEGIDLSGRVLLQPGATDQTVTEAVYSSGERIKLTESVEYGSSDEAVALISNDGEVTALSEGMTVISADYGGFTDSYTLRVTSEMPTLTGIELKGPVELAVGTSGDTVVSAVYEDGSRVPIPIAEDILFESSYPSVAQIDETGRIQALQSGQTTVSVSYGSYSDSYELSVYAPIVQPDPGPAPTPQTPVPSVPGPSAPEPSVPAPPIVDPNETDIPVDPGVPSESVDRVVRLEELSSSGDGEPVTIVITGTPERIRLPVDSADLLGRSNLILEAEAFRAEISSAVLAQMAALLPDSAASSAALVLQVTEANTDMRLNTASSRSGAELQAVSKSFDWMLAAVDSNGTEYEIAGDFAESVRIELAIERESDRELTALYRIMPNGMVEYVGGEWNEGKLSAQLNANGTYAVLVYDKTFADLPRGHWAEEAIKILSARQLVTGISTDTFEPNRQVTRAEFATMLVRTLNLEGAAASEFADVSAGSWYAESIALAKQVGLVQGDSADNFEPDRSISRGEMAVMLVRTYAYMNNGLPEIKNTPMFVDLANAPAWQQEAAVRASELGLVQGQGEGKFKAAAGGTRAESTQMIVNLLRSTTAASSFGE